MGGGVQAFGVLFLGTLLLGCSDLPVDLLIAPTHGAITDAGTVYVLGRVANDPPTLVTVNGSPATVSSNGTWFITLPLDADAVVRVAQGLEVDPQRSVEDELELARQVGPCLALRRRQTAQVEELGGARVVAVPRRRDEAERQSFLAQLLPWTLTIPYGAESPIAASIVQGETPYSMTPVYFTLIMTILFIALSLWRFEREEF